MSTGDTARRLRAIPRYAFDHDGAIYGPVDAAHGTFIRDEDLQELTDALVRESEVIPSDSSGTVQNDTPTGAVNAGDQHPAANTGAGVRADVEPAERHDINREAYERLIAEDLAWLTQQPRTLECDHVEVIVRQSPERYYGPAAVAGPPPTPDGMVEVPPGLYTTDQQSSVSVGAGTPPAEPLEIEAEAQRWWDALDDETISGELAMKSAFMAGVIWSKSRLRAGASVPASPPQFMRDAAELRSSYGYLLMRLAVAKDAQDSYDVAKREFGEHEPAMKRLEALPSYGSAEWHALAGVPSPQPRSSADVAFAISVAVRKRGNHTDVIREELDKGHPVGVPVVPGFPNTDCVMHLPRIDCEHAHPHLIDSCGAFDPKPFPATSPHAPKEPRPKGVHPIPTEDA